MSDPTKLLAEALPWLIEYEGVREVRFDIVCPELLSLIARVKEAVENPPERPTCKNCRWWDDPESVQVAGAEQHAECKHSMNGSEDRAGVGWYAIDWQGSNPDQYLPITTGPDFSCIHHEPQPKGD